MGLFLVTDVAPLSVAILLRPVELKVQSKLVNVTKIFVPGFTVMTCPLSAMVSMTFLVVALAELALSAPAPTKNRATAPRPSRAKVAQFTDFA
jgi:hypothetical protein